MLQKGLQELQAQVQDGAEDRTDQSALKKKFSLLGKERALPDEKLKNPWPGGFLLG